MNESPFGASTGQIDDLSSQGLTNDFKTVSNNDVTGNLGTDRVQPRDIASGVMRGTQRIVNTDGSYITLGEIPDNSGQFGIAYFSQGGTIISKGTAETDYKYNATTGKNYYQNGKLSDGSYGIIIVKDGVDVDDVIG